MVSVSSLWHRTAAWPKGAVRGAHGLSGGDLNLASVGPRFGLGAEVSPRRSPSCPPRHHLGVRLKLHAWLPVCLLPFAGWFTVKVLGVLQSAGKWIFPHKCHVPSALLSPVRLFFSECPRLAKGLARLCRTPGSGWRGKKYISCVSIFLRASRPELELDAWPVAGVRAGCSWRQREYDPHVRKELSVCQWSSICPGSLLDTVSQNWAEQSCLVFPPLIGRGRKLYSDYLILSKYPLLLRLSSLK